MTQQPLFLNQLVQPARVPIGQKKYSKYILHLLVRELRHHYCKALELMVGGEMHQENRGLGVYPGGGKKCVAGMERCLCGVNIHALQLNGMS